MKPGYLLSQNIAYVGQFNSMYNFWTYILDLQTAPPYLFNELSVDDDAVLHLKQL